MKSLPTLLMAALGSAAMTVSPLAQAQPDYTQAYTFTTLAGTTSAGHRDGEGAAARFYFPAGMARDAAGNLYVADNGNHIIRRVTPSGNVTTIAGIPGVEGANDGTAATARFSAPRDVAVDAAGNLYVADGNATVRKITPAGIVTTLAGSAGQFGGANGTGTEARFGELTGIAVDAAGNVYVSEQPPYIGAAQPTFARIRKITPLGVVTTLAGSGTGASFSDGTGESAAFKSPLSLMLRSPSELIVVDAERSTVSSIQDTRDFYIRSVTLDGVVTTLERITVPLRTWENGPSDVTFDAQGNRYEIRHSRVVRIAPDRTLTVVAGGLLPGGVDGQGAAASFEALQSIVIDAMGNLLVTDGGNAIRKITPDGQVTTLAGLHRVAANAHLDAVGSAARFHLPRGVGLDPAGNVLVADTSSATIRKISPAGVVSTVAGQPGQSALNRPDLLYLPRDVASDAQGNLYVADGNSIRKVTPAGAISVYAGDPDLVAEQSQDGPRETARLASPWEIVIDAAGVIYFSEPKRVRRIDATGNVTTVAGPFYVDAVSGEPGEFGTLRGLGLDASSGHLFAADIMRNVLYRITPGGSVTVLAGRPGQSGAVDGAAAQARFDNPEGVAVDRSGNIIVTESLAQRVRRISPQGLVTTIGGLFDAPGGEDGIGRAARFHYPTGVVADADNAIYLSSGNSVRKGVLLAGPAITTQPQSQTVTAGAGVQFSVAASGSPAPTYQWNFNGNPIGGATAATYVISNTAVGHAGDYTVTVANAEGSVTSSVARLTVNVATANPATTPPASGGATPTGGGGGANEPFLTLAVALLWLARSFASRRS